MLMAPESHSHCVSGDGFGDVLGLSRPEMGDTRAQGVCWIQELGICIIDAPSNFPRQKVGVLRAEYEEEVVDVELDPCLVVENVH